MVLLLQRRHQKTPEEDEFRRNADAPGKGGPNGGPKGDKGDPKGKYGGKGKPKDEPKGGKDGGAKGGTVNKMIEYLKSKPASYFTEVQQDGQPRALCESYCLDGKCQHGSECIFGQHGGHPSQVSEEHKKVCRERKAARAERQKKFKESAKERKTYAEMKRRIDAGEDV